MLDIKLFREDKGGNPEQVRESQRRRFADVDAVDKVIELDNVARAASYAADQKAGEMNATSKAVAAKRKAKEDASAEQARAKEIKGELEDLRAKAEATAAERDALLSTIGNLVHDSVPVDNNEDHNTPVKTWGEPRTGTQYNHVDMVNMLDIVDLEAGTAVAGNRGYYLKGAGVLLNQALINFALQFGFGRGYTPIQTPYFMNKDIMGECAQLGDFDEALYHVTGDGGDKYLIATSEQTLCAMHRKRWMEVAALPQRLVGYSTCFRKETGSHGRDTLGIFRVHQFEKVEQFCLTTCEGDASWDMLDEMLGNAEAFYQALGLPYQVVNIVSGALNDAAAKKYDLEAWFPSGKDSEGAFRELVSASNCTDYQARKLDVRMRVAKAAGESDKKYVHMLNSTLTATERTLCCVLENYQTETGFKVPDALKPFMMGIDFLPFKKMYDPKGKLVDFRPPAAAELTDAPAS